MKHKVIEVNPPVDKEKSLFHFDFEPDLGKQHLPELRFEGNNLDEVFRATVNAVNQDRKLRDDYILTNVGRVG